MKENLIRNSYLNSFNIDDKSKGLEHLIIINTKCLVDDKIQRYVYIDNNRLKDELRYYNFYGTKPSYDDILNILLPLILSNTNIQKCEDEVVSLIQKYVKYLKKVQLSEYLDKTSGIKLDPNSIFDIQTKRLHEYKRQQMNLLYIINKYQEIKAGKIPERPITFIFGAKAAPAYTIAQDIIHAILVMQETIKNDKDVSPYMNVVMLENYNVSLAEKVIPACDISEQISLASKEASGTGNMKFMLNGAVTLGTDDGANVEIHELVGDDNIYIFGKDSDTVIKLYEEGTYNPKEYYDKNNDIKNAIDFLTSDIAMKNGGNYERLNRLKNELLYKDWFKTLLDFEDYKITKDKAFKDYENRNEWKKKMLVNISQAGYFSSDRTISDYNKDIWKLK